MSTKCVKMCRNGDGFFPPVNVVINPRDIRNMDAFLDRVTQATRMGNAARRVCTPRKGHRIEDLTKLISGETYVAVGREGFKSLEYSSIRLRRPALQRREVKIEPVKHSRILMSARCRKVALWESSGLKTVYVYRNGDDKQPSHRILLDRRILLNMDKVLEHVTERVKLESGAVFGLFTLHGKEVNSTSELLSGAKYVAVGHGKRFKRTAYNDNHKVSPNNSPRRAKVKYKVITERKSHLPSANGGIQEEKVFVEKGIGNEIQGKTIVTTNVQELNRTRQHVQDNTSKRKEESVHNEAQSNVSKPDEEAIKEAKPSDYIEDKPHNDVYKASGVKSEKGKQVDDDQEIKVEKPIDQLPAEEVVEEIVEQDLPENSEQTLDPKNQVKPSENDNEENEDNVQETQE